MKVFCSIHDLYERQNSQRTSHLLFGSYEIWSNKLKLLYNKPHGDTEGTELKAISRRCRRHIERWSCSVQTPDSSWDKRFGHKVTNKTRNQHPSLHTPSVPPCHHLLCFNNPPHPPFLCVTFRQKPKFRRIIITLKFWRPSFFHPPYRGIAIVTLLRAVNASLEKKIGVRVHLLFWCVSILLSLLSLGFII